MRTHAARSGDLADIHRAIRAKETQRKKEKAPQAKSEGVSVSHPSDASEKQAEHIGRKIASGEEAKVHPMHDGSSVHASHDGDHVSPSPEFTDQLHRSKGSGSALPRSVQRDLGGKMGANLSDVKVHTDDRAHRMSESINAKAFTHGQDIYFKNGNYNTSSAQGKELLAHELVHTQQQKGGAKRKVQRSFWGDVWEGVKSVGNFVYEESGLKSIVDTGIDIYHWAVDSPEEFQVYMQGKLKAQIDELKAAKTPTWKFIAAYWAAKGVAIMMNPLALFLMPSKQALWEVYVQGKLGYYTYLYNLGNEYIDQENIDTGKTERVKNVNYKKGGYAAVFSNQMRNMFDPRFLLGEVVGIFKGIGNWFLDIWEMIKFLGEMMWSGVTTTWNLVVNQEPPKWMTSIMKGAQSAGAWFAENGRGLMEELGELIRDPAKLKQTLKDIGEAIKTGASALAWAAGEGIASMQVKVMSKTAYEQGEMFGKAVGYLIPEIVIAVFTETIVNWIKLGVKGIQVFWKSIQALKLITKVGEAANGVVRAFTKIGKVFKTMSGKIGGKLGQMFDKIMDFFKGLTKWGDEVPNKTNKTSQPHAEFEEAYIYDKDPIPPNKTLKGGLLDDSLIAELKSKGVKFTETDLQWVFKNDQGKIFFLEKGNPSAGFEHILTHKSDFLTKGIPENKISDFIMKALQENKIVGFQGKGTGRPIYELIYDGIKQRVGITTGSNGFVVGANPVSF